MPTASHPPPEGPLRVSILTQGSYLIASVHTALDDGQLVRFRRDLLEQIGQQRSRGVIIDVAALDVIDSFACHTLCTITQVARLRGAETVVVGIQPDVAHAMVRLGVSVGNLTTALDLEDGMTRLEVMTSGAVFLPGRDAR